MNKDLINRKNTREWIKCNDDARSHINRESFISEHGGEFVKSGRFWEWRSIHIDEKTKYEFEDADGKITIVENLSKFCRDNDLNKGAIHKVIKGERSHHKGYTCRKI